MKVLNVKDKESFMAWVDKLDAEAEEYALSRNQPISNQPEDIQEIRVQDGKEN